MNLVSKIWIKLMDLIDGSVFFTAIDRFLDLIGRIGKGSIFYPLLTKEPSEKFLENTIIYKFFNFIFSILIFIKNKFFDRLLAGSFIYKKVTAIQIDELLKGSSFLKIIANVFDFNYTGIGMVEVFMLLIVFMAPFLPTLVLAAMLALEVVLYFMGVLTGKYKKLNFDIVWLFIFIYIIITLICGFTSLTPISSIQIALLTTLFMFSYFLVVSIFNTRSKLNLIIFTFSVSSLFVGLIGLYQKISGQINTTWTDTELFEGLSLRVVSTFGNPNVYGEYLLLMIPIVAVMVFISKHALAKTYYFLLTMLLILNLGLTYSRGCYLAILAAMIIFILFREKKLIVLFSIGIFILPFFLPDAIIDRFLSITNFTDSSTSYRINIWQGVIRMLQDYWYIGLGQGEEAFNSVYPLYSFNGIVAPHSHDVFFQVIVETGIAGFVAFIAMLLAFMKNSISTIVHNTDIKVKVFLLALICGFIGFFIQGIFDYVFYNYRVFLVFFIFMGTGGAYVNIIRGEQNESN